MHINIYIYIHMHTHIYIYIYTRGPTLKFPMTPAKETWFLWRLFVFHVLTSPTRSVLPLSTLCIQASEYSRCFNWSLSKCQIDRSEHGLEHGLEHSRQTSASMWPAKKIAAWAKSERLSAALGRHAAELAAAGGLAALDDAWLQAHGVVLASARTKALAAARVALAPRKQLRWGEVQLIHYEAEARSHKGPVHIKLREGFAVEGF